MGVSTDGIIFFGFNSVTDDEYAEECHPVSEEVFESHGIEGEDWEELLAVKSGAKHPGPWIDDEEPKGWSEFRDKVSKIVKDMGCEIDYHCSGDYPLYYVAVTGVGARAYRGETTVLKPEDFIAKQEWTEKLKKFCELLGIKYREPEWHLCSCWD